MINVLEDDSQEVQKQPTEVTSAVTRNMQLGSGFTKFKHRILELLHIIMLATWCQCSRSFTSRFSLVIEETNIHSHAG